MGVPGCPGAPVARVGDRNAATMSSSPMLAHLAGEQPCVGRTEVNGPVSRRSIS